jgi:hypothetical protein
LVGEENGEKDCAYSDNMMIVAGLVAGGAYGVAEETRADTVVLGPALSSPRCK